MRRLAAFLLAALILSGCTLAPKPEQAKPSTAGVKGKVRLLTMGPTGLEPTMLDSFKMVYPNVTVESAQMPEGDFATVVEKLKSGEAGIDVIIAPGNGFLFRQGAIQPLDDLIKSHNVKTDVYGSALKFGQHDGKTYGLPVIVSPMTVVYNKDLLEKAQAPLPGNNWNWDQFAGAARKLKPLMADKPKSAGAAIAPWTAVDLILTAGAGPAGADLTAVQTALTRLHQYELLEQILPVATLGDNDVDYFGSFAQGNIGMMVAYWGSSTGHTKPQFAWNVAPLPGDAGALTPAMATLAMMTPKAQDPEAAFALVKYASGPMGASTIASMPGAPIPGYVDDTIAATWLANAQLPEEAKFLLKLNYLPPIDYPEEVGVLLLKEIDATLSGKKSPTDAIRDFKQAREPLLSKK